jgi:kumamolisin
VFAGLLTPEEKIQITLILRRNQEISLPESSINCLTASEFRDRHGARQDDLDAVIAFARKHNFRVVRSQPEARSVTLEGALGELSQAFRADVRLSAVASKSYRTRQGQLSVPTELADCIVGVLGFDESPVAATYHRHTEPSLTAKSFTPLEIASLYQFPATTGKGQTIALIELGGGYRDTDLQSYWKQLKLAPVKTESVAIDSAQNSPVGDPDSADGEVVLDIEVAGAVAPEATIAVYFAPNTDAGFLAAINAAIHDNQRKPSVISISWGSAESEWSSATITAFNNAFHDAALLGITVCAAAGDNGSSDGEQDGKNHVDFPASSPWVLACGGTRLYGNNGQILQETVWNDGTNGGATGGGISTHFPKPSYQASLNIQKRGVPDVAGVADPETGFQILVDGQEGVVGGTSAVAPLWAGLIALCNEELGKNIGWFHPTLYGTVTQHKILHDITVGNNGTYHASIGWDCCTGLGTPNGTALLDLLKKS